jgi:thioredoxin 1
VAGNITELKGADFDSQVVQAGGAAIIDFWAAWCGPCRALSPLLDQAAQEYKGKAKFFKVNIEESSELAGRFGIRSIPTLLFFKDGKVQDQIVGLVPLAQLKAAVDKIC